MSCNNIIFGMAVLSTIDGCPVQKLGESNELIGTPLSRLYAAVRQAEEQIRDGVIDLSAVPPLSSKTRSTLDIKRPRDGETVRFACDAPSNDTQGPSSSDSSIVWRHRGSLIFTNSTPPKTADSFFYSVSKVHNTHYLFIHNISLSAAGGVQCLQECVENSTAALCLRKEYQIRPKRNIGDVFVDNMQNVSTRYWSFQFECKAWIRVPDEYPQFFWKYDNVFISTSHGHYLAELFDMQTWPYGLKGWNTTSTCTNAFCQCTRTFNTSKQANLPRTAVECWIQPDPSLEEYFVQRAYVTFR